MGRLRDYNVQSIPLDSLIIDPVRIISTANLNYFSCSIINDHVFSRNAIKKVSDYIFSQVIEHGLKENVV